MPREPDWDRPERITPPDEQEVECRECGRWFDQADGKMIQRRWHCGTCAAGYYDEERDMEDDE